MPLDYPLPDPTIYNTTYFYPLGQASSQPPSQEPFSSVTGPFDHNSICIGVNELLNTTHYGYTENNENRAILAMDNNLINDNPPSVYYPLSHSSVQTPPTPTRSNNASMTTNAASHGQTAEKGEEIYKEFSKRAHNEGNKRLSRASSSSSHVEASTNPSSIFRPEVTARRSSSSPERLEPITKRTTQEKIQENI
ncbi:10682_t:CDS:2 [Paraglomus brasilianum]|uniref:10682_t:CDS:1 n=1 Tax=Paraglomus brasilianum TaxID=144538 RepID=A0A9N9BIW3_9GLOM|nr:10682_t:CDS:2 [Paraglomus brasilianum]